VGPSGAVDPGSVDLDDDTALVSVMLANNETGVLQPLPELAARAHRAGALVHTDAAQAVGKVPVDVDALGVDLLTVAGHKLYAPKGVGALYVRRGTPLAPFALGAGHESGRRPGTENVASIVGLGVACALAARDLHPQAERQATLRDQLFHRLAAAVPGLVCVGGRSPRLPNTLCVLFPDTTGDAVLQHAREAVAASTGSACHAGEVHPSAVLLAMGISPGAARGSVRLSLGRGTTDDDIAQAAAALGRAWHTARG
jgi:cysteine desulfurase